MTKIMSETIKSKITQRKDKSLALDLFLSRSQLDKYCLELGNQPQTAENSIFKRITIRKGRE